MDGTVVQNILSFYSWKVKAYYISHLNVENIVLYFDQKK